MKTIRFVLISMVCDELGNDESMIDSIIYIITWYEEQTENH